MTHVVGETSSEEIGSQMRVNVSNQCRCFHPGAVHATGRSLSSDQDARGNHLRGTAVQLQQLHSHEGQASHRTGCVYVYSQRLRLEEENAPLLLCDDIEHLLLRLKLKYGPVLKRDQFRTGWKSHVSMVTMARITSTFRSV